MLKNGLRNLMLHGEIKTTQAKAKEFKRLADKLINKALVDTVPSRRSLHQFFGKRDIVNSLVDRVAPAFKERKSGFTRIVKIGRRRGDNVEMVRLELINKPENLGTLKKPSAPKSTPAKKKTVAKKAKPAPKKVAKDQVVPKEKKTTKKAK